MDHVESKGAGGPAVANGSPDRNRMSTYRKAAEEAISQYRAGQGSRSAFGSAGGVTNNAAYGNNNFANGGGFATAGGANMGPTGGGRSTQGGYA